MNSSIFKAYGIRGIYNQELFLEDFEKILPAAVLAISQSTNQPVDQLKIVLCKDVRLASEDIYDFALQFLPKLGVTVYAAGHQSINDCYFAVGHFGFDGCLMATASHNPPVYGGLKIIAQDSQNSKNLNIINGLTIQKYLDQPCPMISDPKPVQELTFSEEHLQHILSFINKPEIKPFKVVFDSGNGMAAPMVKLIATALHLQATYLFDSYDPLFPNRPPNPLAPGATDKISAKVLETKADFGVMFDIDADRIFFIDELGQFVPGDLLLLLMTKSILVKNPGASIVYNVICSHSVPELVTKWGGRAHKSPVGYINTSQNMELHHGLMSGEVSGHFAFAQNWYKDNAFIALVLVLETISQNQKTLSEIINDLRLYSRGDEINIKVSNQKKVFNFLKEKFSQEKIEEIDGLTVELKDWWFNCRPSNTEPLLRLTVETKAPKELNIKQKELIDLINSSQS